MNDVKDVEALFGSRVFTRATMRERLPKNVYKEVIKAMDCGGELSPATADVVAKAMKDWAVENGATHYTHWFQPLTGITAEKHDSFITHPDVDGKMLMELRVSRMLLRFLRAGFVQPLKHVAILHGILRLRHSCARMQRA